MKKTLIFTFILGNILFCNSVYANNENTLSTIENSFYGFNYSNDSIENRVNRLEKTIYGKQSNGNINKRITKLSADISADVIGQEISPVKDTLLAEELEEDNTVNYPIIDEIEINVFGATNAKLDFHSRIVKIEKKLFNKIYDVDDYAKRVDRIKEKLFPEKIADYSNSSGNYTYFDNDNTINSKDLYGTNQSRFNMPFGQKKYSRPYTNYGDFNNIDDAISTDRDNLSDDLSKMEYDMFGTEFSNDDTQTRIKRLNSVNKAKKSSARYDSQKFSQYMSTAMEIGAMILMILAMVL